MELNWLDILLLVILGITVIIGAVKGFIRQVVGLAAVIVGLLLALRYYEEGARAFGFISSETLSQLLGFWLIFFGVLLLGWLVNRLLAKAAKGPLKSMNHFLGAGLGFVKGLLICGVVVFGLLVFPVDEKALKASRLAPYSLMVARAAYTLIPEELKQKFRDAYRDLLGKEEKDVGNA